MIDLDQKIIVPIIDEQIGASYEMEMTIAEMFDKFCEGLQPEVTEAVPVEWLDAQIRGYASALKSTELKALVLVKQMWEKEQEANNAVN